MAERMNALTMDELITGLGDIRATTEGKGQEICQAAVNILFAISEEGAKTAEDALDILHDYQLQGKQYATLQKRHMVAGKPRLKDGVWHCPDCNGRCSEGSGVGQSMAGQTVKPQADKTVKAGEGAEI